MIYIVPVHDKRVKSKDIILTISILKLYKLLTCLLDVSKKCFGKI